MTSLLILGSQLNKEEGLSVTVKIDCNSKNW